MEREEGSAGSSSNENAILQKLKGWRAELGKMNTGGQMGRNETDTGMPQEGGLFTD